MVLLHWPRGHSDTYRVHNIIMTIIYLYRRKESYRLKVAETVPSLEPSFKMKGILTDDIFNNMTVGNSLHTSD